LRGWLDRDESVRSALDAVTVVGDTSLRDALFLALHTAAPEVVRVRHVDLLLRS